MKILAIETSCDETAAAVVEDGVKILSNVVASSAAMHEKYGGIVPEVAAREQLKCIIPTINEALSGSGLKDLQGLTPFIDAIAVTVGPGLIGSLLVGVETAKTIAFAFKKPIIPVNHVIAHMYANFIQSGSALKVPQGLTLSFPAISLVVSGGHTELYLMESIKKLKWLGGTLDDAAGECFDKTARLLGFGSRGGPAIAAAATKSANLQITLPRPMIRDETLNFSFSGLKTAILREVNKLKAQNQFNNVTIQQLAFEVQEAITDVLVEKTVRAARKHRARSILLSGGVAANKRLREKLPDAIVPSPNLCTDNAVYIASYAFFRGTPTAWHNITAIPDLSVEK